MIENDRPEAPDATDADPTKKPAQDEPKKRKRLEALEVGEGLDAEPELESDPTGETVGSDESQAAVEEPMAPAMRGVFTKRAFAAFPLSPEVLKGIAEKGYEFATPVQSAAIEPAIAGKDLIVRAKTGTGKTCAFCIPMIERLEAPAGKHTVRAIILAPTRELAIQVAEECTALAKYKDLRVTTIYGGVGFGSQEQALQDGVDIVVGTPGRILDHLRRRNLDLSKVEFACLDEADEMLSMGFLEDVT